MNQSAVLTSAATDFDGSRLTVARRLRRCTKADLARRIGVTPTAVAQYEAGRSRPTQPVLAQICLSLGLPRDFFGAGRPMRLLPASTAHFRSLRATSAAAREQALAFGEICLEVVDLISSYVDFPEVSLPDVDASEEITDDDIVMAAASVRRHWGVDSGPLPSVVQLMEANGVVTLRLPNDTDPAVSAFSTNQGGRPLVFLAQDREDRARSRFDAAHELGHLLLHPDTEPGSKIVEGQAQAFAAELLMPREEIVNQLPLRIDWAAFHDLKQHWGVSLRALVYRAHLLGRLSDASYRRANQQLSAWGYPEPGPLGPAESPQLLGMARQLMTAHGIDFDRVLAQGRISTTIVDQIMRAASADRPRITFD